MNINRAVGAIYRVSEQNACKILELQDEIRDIEPIIKDGRVLTKDGSKLNHPILLKMIKKWECFGSDGLSFSGGEKNKIILDSNVELGPSSTLIVQSTTPVFDQGIIINEKSSVVSHGIQFKYTDGNQKDAFFLLRRKMDHNMFYERRW